MTIANAYHIEIASLRAQLEEAQEELRQLKGLMEPPILFPPEWRLTRLMCRLLLIIVRRGGPIMRDGLFAALYDESSETQSKTIDVHVSLIRKRLHPYGIEIETIWGLGYRMPAASRAIVLAAIEAEKAANSACFDQRANSPLRNLAARTVRHG